MTPPIVVIGDLIIDHTVYVEPSKIAQEAPIIAYKVKRDEFTHGGAGAVEAMIHALDAKVLSVTFAGREGFQATCKTRYVCAGSRNPTIVGRFDEDTMFEWTEETTTVFRDTLTRMQPKIVALSDYGKGVVRDGLAAEIRDVCPHATIVVDPYTSDWEKYDGADIILPSRAAAAGFLEDEDLRGFSAVVTKLDAEGCRLYGAGPVASFASNAMAVADVTGAGDQFLAAFVCSLGNGFSRHPLRDVVFVANVAAGMQCERMGIVPVTTEDLKKRLVQMNDLAAAS